ncbi:MAG: hypothetical protein KJ648_07225 [Candidatus Omnitrophica bacterium]|nr:hypothetical protein [Candidatus Omnitrophota bacterium]
MALRFQTTSAIALAGTAIPHGLGVVPDEISAIVNSPAGTIYLVAASAATSTNVYIAAASAATTAFVVVASNHSIIK